MRRIWWLVVIVWALTGTAPAADHELLVDLSESVVAITTGFVGSDLLLFGATEGDGDVIVVLLGDSIASSQVPEVGDKVTIESNAYWIKALDRDPDKAAYTMICKSV